MRTIKPFTYPIYVTRPLLPDLNIFKKKLEKVWTSRWVTNEGPQHENLEKRLKKVLNVPYISLFNNGTIALIVACRSLRLSGDVITTPFTFPATPHVLTWNNIRPIFCDIDPVTMAIDANKIESMITPQTTAILAVHVFGTPCDVDIIQEVADRYGLKVIYDAAHAFQTEIDGVGIGNFGDISMFSFHATKLFHTGEGGALTFREKSLKDRIDLLKNFGIKNEEEVVMPGINGKMNEIQAAFGLLLLDYVEKEWEKRKLLIDTYRKYLNEIPGIRVPKEFPRVKNSNQYFVILIDENEFGISRDTVHKKFKGFNVITRKYFYPLCSDYTCYRQLPSADKNNLPIANKIVKQVLCLPLYGGLKVDEVDKICEILLSMIK